MIEKSKLTKVLRLLTATIDGLDQNEIDQLIAGRGRLTFTPALKPKVADTAPSVDREIILSKLNECNTREEAKEVLGAITSRDSLGEFARAMKIHVVKHDRRENIEAKIVEFVIGGKLRTEAIQSLNLKGGSNPPQD